MVERPVKGGNGDREVFLTFRDYHNTKEGLICRSYGHDTITFDTSDGNLKYLYNDKIVREYPAISVPSPSTTLLRY